jgi:TRAP-type uncharacterized transport system substrate-binding protein
MPKKWVILTCMLLLGSAGSSEATPLDSPGIVYIDGTACNKACQSYMAWSRKIMPIPGEFTQHSAKAAVHHATGLRGERSKLAAHARIARQVIANSNKMPRERTAGLQPAGKAAATHDTRRANIAGAPPKGASTAGSDARTIQEQVTAATVVAEQVTTPTAPDQKAKYTDRSEAVSRGDAAKTTPASLNNTGHLVALVMARPEIKSVSDLTGKDIAIDDGQSSSSGDVRTAIAAAGASEVQLSKGQTRALNRVISGEVPAAVLTLVYPEAAEWFPEIAGFRIFRIPLAPYSLQARLDPADADFKPDAAPAKIADSPAKTGTRTMQEQVAAATALAEHVTAASVLERKSNNTDGASPNNTDDLVAVLVARAEIKSISALTGKDIAIDDRQSTYNGIVRTAIAAAGATEVQLIDSPAQAIDRLIGGDVPAAVLTLVSAEAADWFPDIKGFKVFRIPLAPRALQARLEPANAASRSDAKSDAPPAKIANLTPEAAANSSSRTIQQQVAAATTLAEQVTASTVVPARDQKADITVGSGHAETALRGDAEKTAPVSPITTDPRVALVMARPEIKSVSDLANKNVAIDNRQTASNNNVRTAIVAAGAAEVKLSDGQTKAVDRLISGEVQAAVLTLVSPEAAEWFPDITGFKIFRIPLSPRS